MDCLIITLFSLIDCVLAVVDQLKPACFRSVMVNFHILRFSEGVRTIPGTIFTGTSGKDSFFSKIFLNFSAKC